MFALRLVRLIEDHADELSVNLVKRLKQLETCDELLARVPEAELQHRSFEIYRHITDWLTTKSESEVEERYVGLGARRAQQDVPFSQMLLAIEIIKENLWDFLRQEELFEPQELLGEFDLLLSLDRFFDRISYFAAVGYEGARARQVAHALAMHPA
jgi:hypothetical protein